MTPINNDVYILCEACQKPVKDYGSIKLGTTDPNHRYKGSRRKMIMNYKWKLCPQHFKEAVDKITKAIDTI